MIVGKCPSCGAPVEFGPGASPVVVCQSCQTVVGRSDTTMENHGKVATLVDTDSPLAVGLLGTYEKVAFRIVGCIQKTQGEALWDEWCLEFDDGRIGWLSEAEGDWHILFEELLPMTVKQSRGLRAGEEFHCRGTRFVVEECGKAKPVSAQGRFPSNFDAQKPHAFVDATGPYFQFLTIDFTDEDVPTAFVGRRIQLDGLGFNPAEFRQRTRDVKLNKAVCPTCNGPLSLRAPDSAQRVGCPYCHALIDVKTGGKLEFLKKLNAPKRTQHIPLGKEGVLFGVQWVCIAFLLRSCRVDDVRYPWEEYLLWNQKEGFRWLMCSNGHWTFLTPVSAGIVDLSGFRLFQTVNTKTEYVVGECYWKVSVGEVSMASEYIAPPKSYNSEMTGKEVSWTQGEYLQPDEVKQAFSVTSLPDQEGIAPSQPNFLREKARSGFIQSALWGLAMLLLFLIRAHMASETEVFRGTATMQSNLTEGVVFSEPFEMPRRGNVKVSSKVQVNRNAWMGAEVDLVSQESEEVFSLYTEGGSFSGVNDEGSWTEDTTEAEHFFSAVPAGKYIVRVVPADGTRPGPNRSTTLMEVAVTIDSPRGKWLFWSWVVLLAWPLIQWARSRAFETERWENSSVEWSNS